MIKRFRNTKAVKAYLRLLEIKQSYLDNLSLLSKENLDEYDGYLSMYDEEVPIVRV